MSNIKISDMEEIKENHSFVHLFSSASLRIGEEDWTNLVHTDINLAAQVGLLLLKNNKELEILLDATEKDYDEQRVRADQCEHKVKNLNELFENQSKIYSTLERQVDDLTGKYRQLIDDCWKYKDKNKALWERVESLENECDSYLEKIKTLKEQVKTEGNDTTQDLLSVPQTEPTKNRRNISLPDESTNAFSSQRKRSTTQQDSRRRSTIDSMLFYKTTLEENQKLKDRVEILENQLNILKDKESVDGGKTIKTKERMNFDDDNELNEVFYCENKLGGQKQTLRKSSYFKYSTNNKRHVKENLDSLPTVRHYHELFAEIFAKLQASRLESP